MHESVMSEEQLTNLKADIDAFFEKHRGKVVPIGAANDYFNSRQWSLTRPIWHTLQVYGCVVRPTDGVTQRFPMRARAWMYDHERDELRPADVAPGV